MADSAGVAARLWDEWLPRSVTDRIQAAAGGDPESARSLVMWLAGIHDLGKATPAFAAQLEDLADSMDRAGLRMPSYPLRSSDAPHSACSQVLLERWLLHVHGWERDTARTYAVVPGGHHGTPPTSQRIRLIRDERPGLLGRGAKWALVQDELAAYATELAAATDLVADWRERPLPQSVQVLLTAIVIVADWIASGDLFAYDVTPADLSARVDRAWRRLGLAPHWHAMEPSGTASKLLQERFGLPPGAQSRPVQQHALELARKVGAPCLLIVEAPMGEGKTETSLLCAEEFAARTGAGGVFYALPTMATSDAMFDRVHRWVEAVPDARGPHILSAFLAHGKARLNEEYRGLVREGHTGFADERPLHDGVADEPRDEVMASHVWLTGRKRGQLASMVVGTIDQALFAALKSRHVVLRHLGLANKVVVIDEVHASDDYMKVYLRRLLRWLGEHRVPTILMSATLAPEDRRGFAAAYAGVGTKPTRARPGAGRRATESGAVDAEPASATGEPHATSTDAFQELRAERAYPLLTAVTPDGTTFVDRPEASVRRSTLSVAKIADDDETLVRNLADCLAQGGAAAVVRNTVSRAQRTAELLHTAFPSARIVMVHARLIARDRRDREAILRDELGPTSHLADSTRFGDRPLIVVGTQVLEQSLDVDFDVMVSDLAPVDLILQRAGRLQRHERANRSQLLANPTLYLTGADWSAEPPLPDAGSAAVYGMRDLLASIAVLEEREGRLSLPDDIPPSVAEAAEGRFRVPESWSDAWARADQDAAERRARKEADAHTFLLAPPRTGDLVNWLEAGVGEADDTGQGQAQVRDADASIEVIVVQRVGDEIRLLEHDGAEPQAIPTQMPPSAAQAWALAECTLRLPSSLTAEWRIDRVLRELEANGFAGWQQSPLLKGELVLVLDERREAELAGMRLHYDPELGLLMERAG